ncbi:MAG: hypothetical protein FJY85_03975, partial [Deltaproteobacteria bacterium]|nr:hypothetical protein [Deltaproteobacteria bacterium]
MDVTLSQYRVYYKQLAAKMAFAIVIVAVVPLMVMAGVTRHYFVGSYKQKVLDHLTILVLAQQQKVGDQVTQWVDALRLIGGTTSFEQLSDETVLHHRWTVLQRLYGRSILGLAFCDGQGAPLSLAGSAGLAKGDRLAPDQLAKVLESGSYVGEAHHAGSDPRHFTLAVSVEQSAEKRILMATVGEQALNHLLEGLQRGQLGSTVIMDRSGATVASGLPGGIPSKVECVEVQPLASLNMRGMIVGETSDSSALCIRTNLKDSDWVLEFVVDTKEAYQAFAQPRMLALSTLLLGIGGIVAVAVVVSNRFSRYVARVDQEKQLINEQVVQAGKLAALGEMASGMAHEINNPVGIMVQEARWIGTLLESGPETLAGNLDEIRGSLKEIQAHGTRCRDIILKLIHFTRRDEPDIQSVQLNELVHEIVGLSQQRARLMNIEVRLNLEPVVPLVSVAAGEVEQVLINLINNSFDAMGHILE